MAQQLSTNTFGCAKWIVSSDATQGTHTTIAAALTSASSGDTIFIRPGTYTENPTLKAGVNIAAYECDPLTANVIISGTLGASYSGTVSVSGIRLQTNSAAIVSMTGANATILNLNDCYFNCTNNSGISSTGSNASSVLNCSNCTGNLGTTGINLFAVSNGTINFNYCFFTNTGASTTANTISSAATLNAYYTRIFNPITSSNTAGFNFYYSIIDVSAQNVTAFTCNSTTGTNNHTNIYSSGTATAVSIGAGASFSGSNTYIASTNTTTISGTGTLQWTGLFGVSRASIASGLTLSSVASSLSLLMIPKQPLFFALVGSTITNVTGDGTGYTVLFGTVLYDQTSSYTSGTGTFTAPVTGRYRFSVNIIVGGLAAGNTSGNCQLVTSARTYLPSVYNIGALRDGANNATFTFSGIADLNAAQTAVVVVQVSGGTKIVSVVSNGVSNPSSYFTMDLIA